MLTADQLDAYNTTGYLLLPSLVDHTTLAGLQAAMQEFVDQSRQLTASNGLLDIEPDHHADAPRLRRLLNPVDNHETFRRFALEGPAAQVAMAILGEPVRFHHSKLNFKWSDGGAEVKWHQDIQYWPHSDFSPLTIGVYLDDVDALMGPMGIVPGSHRGPCFDLADDDGEWTGSIGDADLATIDLSTVEWLAGAAGSMTVHNCVCVHGSEPNQSSRPRPLLLQTYSAATSYPLLGVGVNGRTGGASGTVIGGALPARMTVDGRSLPIAPDWSGGGYTTIFDSQDDGKG